MQQILIVLERALATIFAAALVCLLVTGLLIAEPSAHAIHRWGAHVLVIFAWLAIPLAIGVNYVRGHGSWKLAALLVLIFLGLLFTSFTGYLGPSSATNHGEQLGEETKNRFVILHMWVLPAMLFLLSGTWLCLAWRRGTTVASDPKPSG